MSKIRDEMAKEHSGVYTDDHTRIRAHVGFECGWDSALQNASEVLALVSELKEIAMLVACHNQCTNASIMAEEALDSWNKSTTKKREE